MGELIRPQPKSAEVKPDPIDIGIKRFVETARTRREVFGLVAGATGSLILAACGGRRSGDIPPITPTVIGDPHPSNGPFYDIPSVLPPFNLEASLKPADRLQKVASQARNLSEKTKAAFSNFTDAFSQEKKEGFKGLRKLAVTEQTSKEILSAARKEANPVELNHDAVIIEVEHFDQVINLRTREEIGDRILDVYADGIIAGLAAYTDLSKPRAIALEAGHMSRLSQVEQKAADKAKADWSSKAHGQKDRFLVTADTGALRSSPTGGPTLRESEMTFAVCQIVAAKLMEKFPAIIPVLNADEQGYLVTSTLTPTFKDIAKNGNGGVDTYHIRNIDAILPMFDQWRRLAETLQQAGLPMTRLSIHFEGAEDPSEKGGRVITPNFGPNAETSDHLAQAIAKGLEGAVKPYLPTYKQEVRRDLNTKGDEYWMLSAWHDNPLDVKQRNKNNVFGRVNTWIASLAS